MSRRRGKGTGIFNILFSCSLLSVPSEVGIDHGTAEFAVESICRWWKYLGQELYPDAKDIFVAADGGGSNGSQVVADGLAKLGQKLLRVLFDSSVEVRQVGGGLSGGILHDGVFDSVVHGLIS